MTASFSLSITAYADQTGNNPSGVVIYSEPSKEISGDFECIVDNNRGMASIVKYNGKGSEVWIPEKINGLPVKLIGDHAFSGCSTIVKVHMPNTVETIYSFIFSNCANLETVEMSKSLKSMGQYIFHSCPKLKKISLPDSLTSLEHWTFQSCSNLEEVYFPSSITDIKDDEFMFCGKVTIKGYSGSAAEQFAKEKGFPFVDVSASEVVVKVSDICGDIDADNAITSNDALKILRVSIGVDKLIDAQTKLADIDSDGNITSGDALAVLRHSVGIGSNVKIGKKINS